MKVRITWTEPNTNNKTSEVLKEMDLDEAHMRQLGMHFDPEEYIQMYIGVEIEDEDEDEDEDEY